ncbi:MAG: hypothetical protein DRQ43_09740 [Gammaproteobacteria bacterium]|nr:MAG: hypothetical protein DRQ43_09740 [Gammaproteobacteria bacterium]
MITDEQFERLIAAINGLGSRVANLEHYTLSSIQVLNDLLDNAMDGSLSDEERATLIDSLFTSSDNLSSMFFETAKALGGVFAKSPEILGSNKHLH